MGVDLALIGVAEEIADTMKVTGFYQFFTIHASLEAITHT
jgi:anti-anti-sigma regulatory factor